MNERSVFSFVQKYVIFKQHKKCKSCYIGIYIYVQYIYFSYIIYIIFGR